MRLTFPVPEEKKLFDWAKRLIVLLSRTFDQIESQLGTGTIVLWKTGIAIPDAFLECNGTTFPTITYPTLSKVLGESVPGSFVVPTVTPPAGTVAIIRI